MDELLARLLRSPWTRRWLWEDRGVVGLDVAGERWTIRDRGVFPHAGEAVDAWVRCDRADLDAMLAGRVPPGTIAVETGTRDIAPRKRRAHAVLVLAALGWAGPWPDPEADVEHVRLVREALYDLGLGPADARARLFPEGGPLDVGVRVTDGVRRTVVTEGLAGPCELVAGMAGRALDLRALRAAALYVAETGALPPRRLEVDGRALACALHPRFPEGLPLPRGHAWLVEVRSV